MNRIYISIGGNLGIRSNNLAIARELISQRTGEIMAVSSIYETEAWGVENQPDFLNQVLLIESEQTPMSVLYHLLTIEEEMGRVRTRKWFTRLIDLDILFYNQQIIDLPKLSIPHPFLHQRNFVLIPLAEIAPDFIHPIFQKSISQLLEECSDPLQARLFLRASYIQSRSSDSTLYKT